MEPAEKAYKMLSALTTLRKEMDASGHDTAALAECINELPARSAERLYDIIMGL